MKQFRRQNWLISYVPHISEKEASVLFTAANKTGIEFQRVLKDNNRSYVAQFGHNGRKIIYKVPREKNQRLWIRFLTIFRASEAKKIINGMMMLSERDIPSTEPVLYAEKRTFGMVTDSWLMYEYNEGKSCLDRPETYPGVVELLRNVHKKNLLHGDPQIRNFIENDGQVALIDAIPKRPFFRPFDFAYEWAYLRRSNPDIEEFYGKIKESRWYRFAVWYDGAERKFVRTRRKLKQFVSPFSTRN